MRFLQGWEPTFGNPEELRYPHRNAVKRGPVLELDQWKWSSYRSYAFGEPGPVLINETRPVVLKWKGTVVSVAGLACDGPGTRNPT